MAVRTTASGGLALHRRAQLRYSRVSVVGTMNKRYEVVSAPYEPALKLIILEGTWEILPFEIRLWRPWRETTLGAGAPSLACTVRKSYKALPA
jgi:hypothetical protein